MNENVFRILGIAGSLRSKSYNRALLRAARELSPEGVEIDIFDLDDMPLYDQDVEDSNEPEIVQEFKEKIRSADALLIATPEYNYSIPGVLKNALDWASRPGNASVLRHKPIAIMGATTGNFGTTRSQLALRQVFVFTRSYVMVEPELLMFKAAERFDENGNLIDQQSREMVRELVEELVRWTFRLYPDLEYRKSRLGGEKESIKLHQN
jgi:chromate reductase